MKNFKITTSKSIFVLFTIAVILISCNKAVDPLGGEKLSPVTPANFSPRERFSTDPERRRSRLLRELERHHLVFLAALGISRVRLERPLIRPAERLDLPDIWVRKAIEAGVTLVINSDAHAVEELDWMEFGVANARRGWATAAPVANTLGLEAMLAKRKARG